MGLSFVDSYLIKLYARSGTTIMHGLCVMWNVVLNGLLL